MTTPKELADKAKKQIEACQDAWTPDEHSRVEAELHATIDQLQAMAEARQGSGEPVAWGGIDSTGRLVGTSLDENDLNYAGFRAIPLYTAPPSAGDRTHIADLTDTFEQLRKIVGTPEQDADALIAAVRTLATPPSAREPVPWHLMSQHRRDFMAKGESFVRSLYNDPKDSIRMVEVGAWIQYANQLLQRQHEPSAQQATGSGQVLTDGLLKTAVGAAIREWNGSNHKLSLSESTYLEDHILGSLGVAISEAPPDAVKHLRVRWEDALSHTRAALAAATQAQPDAEACKFVRVPKRLTHAMQEVLNEEGWEWRDVLAAAEAITEDEYDAECDDTDAATIARLSFQLRAAAPTTGKREPLSEVWVRCRVCGTPDTLERARHENRGGPAWPAHGITGEQR